MLTIAFPLRLASSGAELVIISLLVLLLGLPSTAKGQDEDVWAFTGLPDSEVIAVAMSPDFTNDATIFSGTDSGIHVSTDGGATWASTGFTTRTIDLDLSPAFGTDGICFALTAPPVGAHGVYRSTDAGASWAAVGAIGGWELDVAVSPNFANDGTVFAGREKSSDGGLTWTTMNLTPKAIYSLSISSDYAVDQTVFAGTSEGVYVSTNGGTSWSLASIDLQSSIVHTVDLSPNFTSDKTVFAGVVDDQGWKVLKSVDGGINWVVSKDELQQSEYTGQVALSPAFNTDGTVFLATNIGLYESKDKGSTWAAVPFQAGFMVTTVRAVEMSPDYATDETIFLGVYGGVFSYPHSFDDVYVALRDSGWSDPTVGSWNEATATGTLTADLNRMILIEADGVTLEGDSYHLTPSFMNIGNVWSVGVLVDEQHSATIKNIAASGFGIGIGAKEASQLTISDNTIDSNLLGGIWLSSVGTSDVTGNSVSNNLDGIIVDAGTLDNLSENLVFGNERTGIAISQSTYIDLVKNELQDNDDGIVFANTDSSLIDQCISETNAGHGLYLYASHFNEVIDSRFTGNAVNGIWLNGSSHNLLENSLLNLNTYHGVDAVNGSGNILKNNTFDGNSQAISIRGAVASSLTGNTISGSLGSGISLTEGANWSTVERNTLTANSWTGIYIADSHYNSVVNNNFIGNNPPQAIVANGTGNSFTGSIYSGGNFWNEWTTPDADNDLIVDSPYIFTGGQDNLPWTFENAWDVNRAPIVNQIIVQPEPALVGGTSRVEAAFSDEDGERDAPFSCSINHGDGSPDVSGEVIGLACVGPDYVYEMGGLFTVQTVITDRRGAAGTSTAVHTVLYPDTGFEPTIDAPPAFNTVKAGAVFAVRFSLGAYSDASIISTGYPVSGTIDCGSAAPIGVNSPISTIGADRFQDSSVGTTYVALWKTEKVWRDTCRELEIVLIDGSSHRAFFEFH